MIFGHSHRQHNEVKEGVLYFNPASAGPRRFSLPISLGKIHIDEQGLKTEFIELVV
ncbi:metallophosphoesterase family protein [Pseudomonadota bacterium]